MFHFQSAARKRVLLILSALCLSLWSVALLETTQARYATKASDSVSVRVASFLVEAGTLTLKSPDAVIDCNTEGDCVRFGLKVRNRSEVAVRYRVVVEGLPSSIRLTTERAEGSLAQNGGEAEVLLSFAPVDRSDRTQRTTIGGVVITVYAEQKGSGE